MSGRASDGGGLMGSGAARDRDLLMARILSCKDWENPKAIQRARHMAHEGCTVDQISAALEWTVNSMSARRRLLKYNIRPRSPKHSHPHLGDHPYLSPAQAPSGTVDQQTWRPRMMRAG